MVATGSPEQGGFVRIDAGREAVRRPLVKCLALSRGRVTWKLTVTGAAPLEANWSGSRDNMIYITQGRLCHSQFSLVAPTCINLIMAW